MKSKSYRWTVPALAAIVALAIPGAAGAGTVLKKDYTKNAATGDYAPQITGPASVLKKDYTKNTATGDYAPAVTPSTRVVTVVKGHGFEWGDAATGAGVALALALIGLGGATVIRRRRIASPARRERPASPGDREETDGGIDAVEVPDPAVTRANATQQKEVIMRWFRAVQFALLALLCAGLVASSPAGATTPTTQTISLVRAFPGGPPDGWASTGTLFSDSGQWTVDRRILGGLPAPTEGAINFFITATGSQGTIDMRFLLDFNQSQEQDLCWIVGGTGAYTELRGQGTFTVALIGGQPHIDCTAALHFS